MNEQFPNEIDRLFPFATDFLRDPDKVEVLHLILQGGEALGFILARVGEGQQVCLGTVGTREFAWELVQAVRDVGAPPQPGFILAAHRARFLRGEMPTWLILEPDRAPLREGPLVVVR